MRALRFLASLSFFFLPLAPFAVAAETTAEADLLFVRRIQARRLTAEELRDSMLRVSGELNPAVGGIPVRPEINVEVAFQPRQVMGTFAEAWRPSPLPAQRHRRSIYALRIRGQLDPFYEVFNHASDPSENHNAAAHAANHEFIEALAHRLAAGWQAARPVR